MIKQPTLISSFFHYCFAVFFLVACGKKTAPAPITPDPPIVPPITEITSTVSIDRTLSYQSIDGFGFFGAKDVWWGSASNLYSDAWANQVLDDLGITIWRNEYFPPATPTVGQDADWAKQKPVVDGLYKAALAKKIPLKFVFTVWSPPASLKVALDANNNPIAGSPNAGGTKNGGTLDPTKYNEFGNWLADGIQLYKDLGIDVYAISPQNEPLFKQSFNSCYYQPITPNTGGYNNMIKGSIPVVKARFPSVKIFGSENMLGIEAGDDRQWFYNNYLLKDPAALSNIDILAVHGYSDGVSPTGSSQLTKLWKTTHTEHKTVANKPYWMTETSGYGENWLGNTAFKSGAINLALDMHAALYHGNASAWIWWQGSTHDPINEFSLMRNTQLKGKKYYVSKHFYRFIRPGAKMIKVGFEETAGIFASAYQHTTMGSLTIVLINNSDKQAKLNLTGSNIPSNFDYYITTASANENCKKSDAKVAKENIILPPYSVVTLVDGNTVEQ